MTTTTKWSRKQIRDARQAHLPTLLHRMNQPMRERGGGNYELIDRPGLIVKNCYWRNIDNQQHGNTIDFLVQILGKSFSEAMWIITQP